MKFIDLPKSLKEKIYSLYILKGEDSFVKNSAVRHISNACGNELNEFNKTIFNDENWSTQKFIESTYMLPIGASYKFILIKELTKLNENDKVLIQKTLKSLPATTCIVIMYNDLWKFLKTGEIVDCSKMSYNLISKFIMSELKKRNKEITPDAIRTLIELCSYDMTRISSELKKVSSYSDDLIIDKEDISTLVTADKEYQIFELTENLGNKKSEKSLQILINFLEKKEPINTILALISNHFRRLAHVSLSEMNERELSQLMGVKEYAIIKAKEQSKLFSKIQMRNILQLLEEVDMMIKSGKMTAENSIFYLIFKILYC